ncbi:T9SS type A sorting domain-containing protein [Chryseobacterium salivictor]|uniref:Secretion system C-terminal sorting domain-containing protein n=1 Tax=Chryseobacterium salivictor TaxID=2547600 RepID=A0A4P6ZCJ0_9FLAO|nr:T9SS type A sorting domain-containing protein [Chryseobacterium salivictor]QBO57220.1 hypothetical protein NBC122_00371 [Chryseobacterium salivictor]
MKTNNFLRKTGFLLFFLFFSHFAMAQAVGDYRSKGDGNWNAIATWEVCTSISPVKWSPLTSGYPGTATVPLGYSTSSVTITHQVTIPDTMVSPVNLSFGDLIINGGKLHISPDNKTIVEFKTTQNVIIKNGTLNLNANQLTVKFPAGTQIVVNIGNGTCGSSDGVNGMGIIGGTCTNNVELWIGTVLYSTCTGNGGAPFGGNFCEVNNAGGTVRATATPSSLCIGNTVSLSTQNYSDATYKWSLVSGPGGYSIPSGTKIDVQVLPITLTVAGAYVFKIAVTRNGATVFDQVSVEVKPNDTVALSSTAGTNDQVVCAGTAINNITYATTGASGISDSGVRGKNGLPAGVSATWASNMITISGTPTVSGTFNYSISLTGGCGSAKAMGTITVNANLPANVSIVANPGTTICAGTSVTFTTIPTNGGASPTYQWYNGVTLIPGATSSTYTSTTLANGDLISVKMTSNASPCLTGSPAISNVLVMAVNPTLPVSVSIAANPGTTICAGTSVTFTTIPTNGGTSPTYQWYNGVTLIPGATSSTYTSTTLTNGDLISVKMTSNASPCLTGSPATSNVLVMAVNPNLPASVSVTTPSSIICVGTPTSFTFTATPTNGGSAPSYQWQVNGINVGTDSPTFTSTSLVVGNKVTVIMTSNASSCLANLQATSNAITIATQTAVYNTGKWTPALAPNLSAEIQSAYNSSAGNLDVCSLLITNNAPVTIRKGGFFKVQNGVTVTQGSSLTVETDGNLIQTNDNPTPPNSGAITVLRDIKIGVTRNQYNYVGSPVDFIAGQNLKTIYPGITFALYHNEANNLFGTSSGANIPGRGLAIKEPTTAAVPVGNMEVTAKYIGVPQNGKINFPLANSNTGTNTSLGYNLLGNPYPSNIDLIKLYELNGGNRQTGKASENISATFYLWDNEVNDVFVQQGSAYNGQAYAIFNVFAGNKGTGTSAAGYLNTKVIGEKIPSQIISVGQGFMTKALAKGYTLVFNNSIRTDAEVTASFLGRTQNQDLEDDRFWLRLISPAKVTSTLAVVYFDGGSDAFGAEDSESKLGSDDIFSLVDNKKIGINGKRAFTIADKIALGTKHFQTGIYMIAAGKREGVFDKGQKIYLKDKQTGTVTNLSEGSYSFEATAGETTGRFEIIYQPDAVLVTDNMVKERVVVYRDGSDFVITSKNEKMTGVEMYDTSGKLISKMQPNSTKVVIPAERMSNGLYILKINQNETVTVKKILK